jgi:hypothetical protein
MKSLLPNNFLPIPFSFHRCPKKLKRIADLGWQKKGSKEKTGLLWSFHDGTFRKFLLIISSRRLEVMLISELGAIRNSS